VLLEIAREGLVRRATIERTSGTADSDKSLLRTIKAVSLSPLPDDFHEPVLRVPLGFSSWKTLAGLLGFSLSADPLA